MPSLSCTSSAQKLSFTFFIVAKQASRPIVSMTLRSRSMRLSTWRLSSRWVHMLRSRNSSRRRRPMAVSCESLNSIRNLLVIMTNVMPYSTRIMGMTEYSCTKK